MKELVRLRMRPSRDRKSFRYLLDYVDHNGRRRQISLGHTDKRKAERQRQEKELELRVNVAEPISMKLTDFFRDSLARTKGQVRTTTLKETAKSMNDFIACVGDIDVQEVRYEHGERFIQYCLDSRLSAGTATKKIKHLKRVFQLAEDRGQLDRHPLHKLKPPKVGKRKVRVFTDQECDDLCKAARQYEERGRPVKWELLIRMCPEETGHAMRLYKHLQERGARILLTEVDAPPTTWDSPLAAFDAAYEHECKVAREFDEHVELARAEKDNAALGFLQWFVNEQVEEEASVDAIVQKLKMIGEHRSGLFMLDRALGERTAGK